MTRRKKILIFSIAPASTSSWYRIMRPFEMLARQLPIDVQVVSGAQVDWTTFTGIDLVVAQRPGGHGHDTILERARERGIPVICDYDDALFAVPYHHVDFITYADEHWRNSAKRCLAAANQVWVTTEPLAQHLFKHQPKLERVEVIPNAVDDYLFPEPTKPLEMPNRSIMWRGGHTHDMDLLHYAQILKAVNERAPMIFFGSKPWMLDLKPNRFTFIPALFDPEEFMRKLRTFACAWHVVPLVDNEFNRCKSNIAFLEASWLGASQTLVPEWWDHPGALPLTSDTLANDESFQCGAPRVARVKEAQAAIYETLRLSTMNQVRAKALAEILHL